MSETEKWLQRTLNKLGAPNLNVDGKVGPLTEAAIRDFQAKQGLKVDGIAGPITIGELEKRAAARSKRLWISAGLFGVIGAIAWVLYNWGLLVR